MYYVGLFWQMLEVVIAPYLIFRILRERAVTRCARHFWGSIGAMRMNDKVI